MLLWGSFSVVHQPPSSHATTPSCLALPQLPCPALPCPASPVSSVQRQRQRLGWIFATATNPAGGERVIQKAQDTYNVKPHPVFQSLASLFIQPRLFSST